jgi:hypothetical protein
MNARVETDPDFAFPWRQPILGTSTEPPPVQRRWTKAEVVSPEPSPSSLGSYAPGVPLGFPGSASALQGAVQAYVASHPAVRLAMLNSPIDDAVDAWIDATAFTSSFDAIRRDPRYSALAQLGWPVVSSLLARIVDGRARPQCALLLTEITHESPITNQDLGRADRIGAAWINWGRSRGFL